MYCTVDDVRQEIAESTLQWLTQDDPSQGVNESVIENAIVDVGERMNSYLRGRYALPFQQKSDFLKSIAVSLVRYQLYMRRPDGGELPDGVVRAYKIANDDLEKISKGDLSLGIQDSQKPQPNHVWRIKVPARRFDR